MQDGKFNSSSIIRNKEFRHSLDRLAAGKLGGAGKSIQSADTCCGKHLSAS